MGGSWTDGQAGQPAAGHMRVDGRREECSAASQLCRLRQVVPGESKAALSRDNDVDGWRRVANRVPMSSPGSVSVDADDAPWTKTLPGFVQPEERRSFIRRPLPTPPPPQPRRTGDTAGGPRDAADVQPVSPGGGPSRASWGYLGRDESSTTVGGMAFLSGRHKDACQRGVGRMRRRPPSLRGHAAKGVERRGNVAIGR
ncbi:hypothetical protein RJ55_04611 [Drechmeria coniospora]|nr:hypothetical protein RJ55_04611 [Drechmeria coniospora]